MEPLLLIGLALGLVVSAAALLYPFWPFARRWQALIVGVVAFGALAFAVPSIDSSSSNAAQNIAATAPAEVTPVELASTTDSAD